MVIANVFQVPRIERMAIGYNGLCRKTPISNSIYNPLLEDVWRPARSRCYSSEYRFAARPLFVREVLLFPKLFDRDGPMAEFHLVPPVIDFAGT